MAPFAGCSTLMVTAGAFTRTLAFAVDDVPTLLVAVEITL